MLILTRFFGKIEIPEDEIINFDHGIPGFEEQEKFIILDVDGKNTLKCLQSTKDKDICLLMITPWEYYKDYEIELSEDEQRELDIEKEIDTAVFNVISI